MTIVARPATRALRSPQRSEVEKNADSVPRWRQRCHALIPTSSIPEVITAAVTVCPNANSAVLLVRTSQIEVSSARPRSGLTSAPTGRCIHALAARMKYADRFVPMKTAQIVARWIRCGSRSQPKIHSPRNVDSRKNAASPSIASGAPNTSPTKREYSLHAIPNWNSCTMPVATPSAKLIRSSLPQNRVMRR